MTAVNLSLVPTHNSISHNLRTYKLNEIDPATKAMTTKGKVIAAPNLKAAMSAKDNTPVIVTFNGYAKFKGGIDGHGVLQLTNDGEIDTGEGSPSYDYLYETFFITASFN